MGIVEKSEKILAKPESKIEDRPRKQMRETQRPVKETIKDKRKMKNQEKNKIVDKKKSEKVTVTEDEELHPSWVAKKQQEKMAQATFQGARTVFEDSDDDP